MKWDDGERWRPSDSAGSALVLVVASVWWAGVTMVGAVLSLCLLFGRPGGAADGNDEL